MLAIQVFYSAILSLFFFSSSVWASPLPVPKTVEADVLFSRARPKNPPPPVPSLDEMKRHLHVPADTSLFYSSNQKSSAGFDRRAEAWASTHPPYRILKQMWTDSRYPQPWQGNRSVVKQFFDVASKAMAELSSGTVYVFMGGAWTRADGKDWYDQSVWARIEWPALQANHNVHTVYRVNADTGATIKIKG